MQAMSRSSQTASENEAFWLFPDWGHDDAGKAYNGGLGGKHGVRPERYWQKAPKGLE